MDYKDKYEKAVQAAMLAKQDTESAITIRILEEIFPELRESEDERIRKAIKKALQVRCDGSRIISDEPVTLEEAVAWLEAQGEQPKKHDVCDNCDQQGSCISPCPMKLVEQNPADKVEPKFKVGDWVIYDHKPYQVVELPKEGCINLGLRGNRKIEFAPSTYCRHWTIQDAKAGDVLMGNAPFIFNGNLEGGVGCPGAYCGINTLGNFEIPEHQKHWTGHNTQPATKEQRDTLMKAMADAGYTFDFEKIQLKKIEQKPAWSEEDEKILKEIISDVKFEGYNNDMQANSYKKINWLKSLKPQNTWKPSDEQIYELTKAVDYYTSHGFPNKILNELLKQLKNL